jgi:predicted CopG family antitoxin
MPKQIKVPDDIHEALTKLGAKNETYGQIIKRLIDFWEEHHKDEGSKKQQHRT